MKRTATPERQKHARKILQLRLTNFTETDSRRSLNRIVAEAGTTKGAVFHHFKGKKDLGTLLCGGLHPLSQQWSDPLANSTDPLPYLKSASFAPGAKMEIAKVGLVHGLSSE